MIALAAFSSLLMQLISSVFKTPLNLFHQVSTLTNVNIALASSFTDW